MGQRLWLALFHRQPFSITKLVLFAIDKWQATISILSNLGCTITVVP